MKHVVAVLLIFIVLFACHKKVVKTEPPQTQPSAPSAPPPSTPPAEGMQHPNHEVHEERAIPTPLAQLKEVPLDIAPACMNSECSVILLYANRIDVLNWKNGETKSIAFPQSFFSPIRSRAPSGKILHFAQGYLVLNNDLSNPVYFGANLDAAPGIYTDKPDWLPLAQSGVNWFALHEGRFYDFELMDSTAPLSPLLRGGEERVGLEKGLAVIDNSFHLSVAKGGNISSSTDRVGGKLCIAPSGIYTSSPSLTGQADAILKFDTNSLTQLSSHPVDGEITDLCVSDLDLNGQKELLATVQTSRGIFIEVLDLF